MEEPHPVATATTLSLYDEPLPVFQTDFSVGSGNALQACVASLFHQELDSVPNFVTLPNNEDGIREFVSPLFNCRKVKLQQSGRCETQDVGKLCLLRGKSPRGDFEMSSLALRMCGIHTLREHVLIYQKHSAGTWSLISVLDQKT